MKKFLSVLLVMAFMLLPAMAMAADGPIKGNMRIVIGSKSTGGDTYQNSSIIAEALADKLASMSRSMLSAAVQDSRLSKNAAAWQHHHDLS